jgi:hypothetical protein
MSSRATLISKSPQFHPSEFMNHLRMGSVQNPHHILTTRMKLWDFIKLSELYLLVHLELRLHLSFYLRRSLRGYMVGTTIGFPGKIAGLLPCKLTAESYGSAHNII